ncbi:MAG: hypothetical protein ACE5JU_18450 [Candidatus Binatia bacterium]
MHRWTWWDVLQGLGAIASITGLLILREGTSPRMQIFFASLIVLGVCAVILSSIFIRYGPPARVGRDAMIDTGRRLIRGAKKMVIMFAGDMSWANDYGEAIHTITSRGKKVQVLYPKSEARRVLQNGQILMEAGAELIATPIDSGLRGILIDAHDPRDALFYVTNRTLRAGAPPIEPGELGSTENYQYVAKVYGMERDWLLIQAATKIYTVFSESHR